MNMAADAPRRVLFPDHQPIREIMTYRHTWADRVTRLRAELIETASPTALALAAELGACGVDWGGRYRCRCPACGRCRRAYIRHQQRAALAWADGLGNADLAFASIVASGTDSVDDITDHIRATSRAFRNRLDASRRDDPDRFGNARVMGWVEIDAVAGDHLPLLGSSRRALLPQIAPLSIGGTDPVWVVTAHSLIDLGGASIAEVNDAFARQWPLPGQVDVRDLDASKPVEDNVAQLASYSCKHAGTITVGAIKEPWPMPWQARLYAKLAEARNANEVLRFSIGPSKEASGTANALPTIAGEDDAMPFAFASIAFPMYNITDR